MLDQEKIKEFEDKFLAPYAQKSHRSKGRIYKEKEHPYRSCYQRDRDRIIHCAAFRRLEYKTQVFVIHEGDYYRTRLTHTLEVAQIARTITSALRLNTDLAEAVSLAHDLGHTPFGHSGEEALAELMKNYGGFNHNLQGLRVVDFLEERYPDFPGLNLTWEVREGIVKHTSSFDISSDYKELEPERLPPLEIQVVDIADEIAYDNHDLDDGITSNLIEESQLKDIEIWEEAKFFVEREYPKINHRFRKYQIIRYLIDLQVSDLIKETERRLKEINPKSSEEIRDLKERIVIFSKSMSEKRKPLREFLLKNLYNHYRVVRMSSKAKRFIQELFNLYLVRPEQLPPFTQARFKKEDIRRVICDYIAGMTDRFCLDEYKKLFSPYERV